MHNHTHSGVPHTPLHAHTHSHTRRLLFLPRRGRCLPDGSEQLEAEEVTHVHGAEKLVVLEHDRQELAHHGQARLDERRIQVPEPALLADGCTNTRAHAHKQSFIGPSACTQRQATHTHTHTQTRARTLPSLPGMRSVRPGKSRNTALRSASNSEKRRATVQPSVSVHCTRMTYTV
jgi:hypothetical protein